MTRFSVRLYATGNLADQLMAYQAKVSEALDISLCSPFCPLTDDLEQPTTLTTVTCIKMLDSAVTAAPQQSETLVDVVECHYTPEQHALVLSSPLVEAVLQAFKARLQDINYTIVVRQPFRLVLAQPRGLSEHEALLPFSETLDWSVKTGWDLKLCQYQDGTWATEAGWPIQQP